MTVAILIPAYNEANTIHNIVIRALTYTDKVIVVDDGSTDETNAILLTLPVILVSHKTNQGKAVSLWTGMKKACELNVDAVITLDADGQHEPEDIPRFISARKVKPKHIIIGARLQDKEKIPRSRYIANKIASFSVTWVIGYQVPDSQSGFRLYPTEMIRQLVITPSRKRGFVFETEILFKAKALGYRCSSIEIKAIYEDSARPSHFNSRKDVTLITQYLLWQGLLRLYNPWGLLKAIFPTLTKKLKLDDFSIAHWLTLLVSNILIILTAAIPLTLLFIQCLKTARHARPPLVDEDFLLVLGMKLDGNDITPDYQIRLDRALQASRQYPNIKTLISGGFTSSLTESEASTGKTFLVIHGLDEDRILLEDQSQHSLENIRFSKKILEEKHYKGVAVITNRYHLYRILLSSQSFGLKCTLYPAEQKFNFSVQIFGRLVLESWTIHWHLCYGFFKKILKLK